MFGAKALGQMAGTLISMLGVRGARQANIPSKFMLPPPPPPLH